MATIKSHTDLEQSKKLAEFLPIESADMYYQYVLPKFGKIKHNPEIGNPINALEWYNKGYTTSGKEPITLDEYCVPCWSLASLLEQIPYEVCDDDGNSSYLQINKEEDMCQLEYRDPYEDFEFIETSMYEHFVDACYEMIIKLHELNLL
jgi:hypothetical protein